MNFLNKYCGNREEIIRKLIPEKNGFFVDFGCGGGYLLEKVQKKYKKAYGYDYSIDQIQRAQEKQLNNTSFFTFDLNKELPLKNGEVDTVICSSALEYLFRPESFLKEVYRVIKKGGVFIVEVPNIAFLPRRLKMLFGFHPHYNKAPGYQGGVLQYFTYASLKKILHEAGFIIEKQTNSGLFGKIRSVYGSLLGGDIIYVCRKK